MPQERFGARVGYRALPGKQHSAEAEPMSHEKLSSVKSVLVAVVCLLTSFFNAQVATWGGGILLRKWVKWLFGGCIVALLIAAALLFV
jgi:hypothetical protein